MVRDDVIGRHATAVMRLGVLAGFLAAAGCSDSAPGDKRDDPALKGSMQKSMEIYKSKSQSKKGQAAAPRPRP
jgi:hypothetical protein